jgi:hypothetical protein
VAEGTPLGLPAQGAALRTLRFVAGDGAWVGVWGVGAMNLAPTNAAVVAADELWRRTGRRGGDESGPYEVAGDGLGVFWGRFGCLVRRG